MGREAAGAAARSTVLETRGVRKHFGGIVALDGVDFRVRRGEIRALIGPNGAGKTTLINVITGLFPPSEGGIWLDGRPITGLAPKAIARRGVVRTFQRTTIFAGCSVLDNVVVACAAARRYRGGGAAAATAKEAAASVLARVGLGHLGGVPASSLSHGDQRLLDIAIGLAMSPAVLLLDEPTAGMSLAETRHMVAVINQLRGTASIVIVEHDMNVVRETADTVTVLSTGRVIAEGDPASIRDNEQVRDTYLGR
jgi:ABC-type branched-subunit amino acid transport system ATPase component